MMSIIGAEAGQLGADMPEGLTREQQMQYMLIKTSEVDLL
jgi:hypothetical protein